MGDVGAPTSAPCVAPAERRPPPAASAATTALAITARRETFSSSPSLRAPRQGHRGRALVPRGRRRAAGAAAAVGVDRLALNLQLTARNGELNERILSE